MKLIDADKLKDYWINNTVNEYDYCPKDVLESIDNQPTVEAHPIMHAHWGKTMIRLNGENKYYMKCSKCGSAAFYCDKSFIITKYCPECGAKMDEEDK